MRLRLVHAVAAVLLAGALAASDLTLTFTSTRKGLGGSASPATEIHYYSSSFMLSRTVETRQDLLVDFKQGITYTINHPKKTIGKMSFDDALAAMDAMGKSGKAGANPMMATVFGDPNAVQVTKLANEQIVGHDCQAWRITVGKLVMELSADPALKPPMADSAYAQMMKARAAQFAQSGPMGATYKRLYEEMAKVKGIPLKTHMTGLMGMDVATLATKVETGPIEPSTFALPAGYAVEDLGKKMREKMAKTP